MSAEVVIAQTISGQIAGARMLYECACIGESWCLYIKGKYIIYNVALQKKYINLLFEFKHCFKTTHDETMWLTFIMT